MLRGEEFFLPNKPLHVALMTHHSAVYYVVSMKRVAVCGYKLLSWHNRDIQKTILTYVQYFFVVIQGDLSFA